MLWDIEEHCRINFRIIDYDKSGLGYQMNKIKELQGANMDIDLVSDNIDWNQSNCPWNDAENTKEHRCAIKNTSICKYFCGIKYLDSVLCSYPHENIDIIKDEEIRE